MEEKQKLLFASLLHDVGKLGYRAGERGAHEEIGKNLLINYENSLPEISSLVSMSHKHERENIFENEEYILIKKLVIADWLASSERIGLDKTEDVKKVGLTPIFSEVSLYNNKSGNSPTYYYQGTELLLEEDSSELFPCPKDLISDSLENNFNSNWKSFKECFKRVDEYTGNLELMFEFLFSLIKKHFKFVPSAAYKSKPDISLFDHSKMVCALALALHNYFENDYNDKETVKVLNSLGHLLKELFKKGTGYLSEIETDPAKKELFENRQPFSLIHGDFSGIQNFIHLITSKYAMKTLKGRSFFLSLLTESIAKYIVKELQLTEANVVFAGGGHFYLISHFSKEIESKISQIRVKTNKILIEQFNADIYLALDYLPLTIKDVIYNISEKWAELNGKTSIRKKRKFDDILKEADEITFKKVFGPNEESTQNMNRCVICNSFKSIQRMSDSPDNWCGQCRSFVELTDALKMCEYAITVNNNAESYNAVLNEFNSAVQFSTFPRTNQNQWFSINKLSEQTTLGFKLIPKAFPLKNERIILDNDDLGEHAKQRTGFNKIGVLKMDVDGLGSIFQRGLKPNNTLSRVSTLSTSLSLFFEGYIRTLAQTEEFKHSIYLIFSGGDDLFIVGSWDTIIEFAYELYKDFRRFTVFNPDVTISAGIVLEAPKFPIIKASVAAENQLDKAKTLEPFQKNKNVKNKISLFGTVLKWDWNEEKEALYQKIKKENKSLQEHYRTEILETMETLDEKELINRILNWLSDKSEFELAQIFKAILEYLIKEKDFSKSLLYKIQASLKALQSLLEDALFGKIEVPKLWRLKYYLRNVLKSNDDIVKKFSLFIVQAIEIIVKDNLFKKNSSLQIKNVEFLSVAVKWADFSTRNINK